MYYAQFGMSNIQPIDHTNLKRLHGMAFSIARIDDDEYKCAKIPGQLFTNEYSEAPDWVLLPEGEGGAKRIMTPWPAGCHYYPPSPRDDIDERTVESTRLPILEGCLISELANGQYGDQQSQPMARDKQHR